MDATTKKREEMGSVKKDGDEEEKEEEEGCRGRKGATKIPAAEATEGH
jgi:hypothetical protein